MQKNGNTYLFLFFLAIILPVLSYSLFLVSSSAESASTGIITATVAVGICGNNIVEYGEDCDGSALDGQTCQSLGYDAGVLTCGISCDFDKSDCVNLGPDEGSVVFSGKAYPLSIVKILKDGQIAATTAADSNGYFETTLTHLIVGSYSFAIYAYDSNGNKSKTITYTKEISKDEVEEISAIVVPPTLNISDDNIKKGEKITFSGQAAPGAEMTIDLSSGKDNWSFHPTAGSSGYYSYKLDTKDYDVNDYTVSAKTTINNLTSESSEEATFTISESSQISSNSVKGWKKVDFNEDSRVNLIDFSILVHWFDQPSFPSKVDVNTDKKVNLSDFSVMMYYWSG